MQTDPTADTLTRIRNALAADFEFVDVPYSRMNESIGRLLSEQGYIERVEDLAAQPPVRPHRQLRLTLRYADDRRPVINGLRRVSRPGRRTYVAAREIPKVLGGMGTAIVSTSHGVMTGHDARREGVGGEVVAEVW